MRMPYKKQHADIISVIGFLLLYYFGTILLTSCVLPCTAPLLLAFDSKALSFSYWGTAGVVMFFFLCSWLRDPGYVTLKPNSEFVV